MSSSFPFTGSNSGLIQIGALALTPTDAEPIPSAGAVLTAAAGGAGASTGSAPKKQVLCICTKCGSPGKLVAPSTRCGHRRREKEKERLAQATAAANSRSAANDTTGSGFGGAPVSVGGPEAAAAIATAQPATASSPAGALTTTSAPFAQTSTTGASTSKFLAVPNPNNPTAGLFKVQKLSTFGTPLPPSDTGKLERQAATGSGDGRNGGGDAASTGNMGRGSLSDSTHLPTLTELHMRNPAQVTSTTAPGPTRRTTLTSFIPPAQPAIQQTFSIAQPTFSSMNASTSFAQQQQYAFTPGFPSIAAAYGTNLTNYSGPQNGYLDPDAKRRISSWAHDTARFAAAETAELQSVRECLHEARKQNEELVQQTLQEKATLEGRIQELQDENQKLRRWGELRNHIWSSIQVFGKTYGRDALPPSLRRLYDLHPNSHEASVYYESYLVTVVRDELIFAQRQIQLKTSSGLSDHESLDYTSIPPLVAPTSRRYTTSSDNDSMDTRVATPPTPVKNEAIDEHSWKLLEEASSPRKLSSRRSVGVRGNYQSLRIPSADKRRRYNPLS